MNNKSSVLIDLSGKIAIVTGGDSGIGRGIVNVLAKSGATVYVCSRDLKKLEQLVMEYQKLNLSIFSIAVDVTDQQSVDRMVEQVVAKHGLIDILVNNAGVASASGWETAREQNDEDWKINYEVNLRGLARVSDAVIKFMKEKKNGKIVNIASNAARSGNGAHIPYAYGATKAAVINLTQTYALNLASYDINVNAICPGIIWTPIWEKLAVRISSKESNSSPAETFTEQVKNRIPLGRAQSAEDIGYMVAFLASELAKNITGQTINVNGGMRMN